MTKKNEVCEHCGKSSVFLTQKFKKILFFKKVCGPVLCIDCMIREDRGLEENSRNMMKEISDFIESEDKTIDGIKMLTRKLDRFNQESGNKKKKQHRSRTK